MKPIKYITVIILLIGVIVLGVFYYNSQLKKQELKPLEEQKKEALQIQYKSLDSSLKLVAALKDSIEQYKNKPPIIIPRYNEKIIYRSVNDSAILNALSAERRNYIQKQKRQLGD